MSRTDDELGMAWWNGLTEQDRIKWSRLAGRGRAKDAWEVFKRGRTEARDDPLGDVHAALLRTVSELRAGGITVPIALHQAIHALTYARAKASQ
jgi:hypothetical protein